MNHFEAPMEPWTEAYLSRQGSFTGEQVWSLMTPGDADTDRRILFDASLCRSYWFEIDGMRVALIS